MLASGLNRTLVDMSAWQRVGAPAWAQFSRWADMGAIGLILYPLEGIGGAVLSIFAAIVFHRRRQSMPRQATVPIDAAALLSLGGMLATTQAAPTLLGTRHHSDPIALQQALDRFAFWGECERSSSLWPSAPITGRWSPFHPHPGPAGR